MNILDVIDYSGAWFRGLVVLHPGGQPCVLCSGMIEERSTDFVARYPGGYKDGEENKAEFAHVNCVRTLTKA